MPRLDLLVVVIMALFKKCLTFHFQNRLRGLQRFIDSKPSGWEL